MAAGRGEERHAARPGPRLLIAEASEAQFGLTLTFIAGAINAGGFMLVGQYTSHMSGNVSAMADHLAVGGVALMLGGLVALLAFLGGAATAALLVNWGRRRFRRNPFAAPLLLEVALLAAFGLLGAWAQSERVAIPAVPLLCFLMGLQNATITKISGARIRTTHVTGIVTDIGIELGKLVYWNRDRRTPDRPFIRADRAKLRLLLGLLASFFGGGVAGALSFGHLGFVSCVPLACILLLLANAVVRPDLSPAALRRHQAQG
ncbi:YoaK family protein [Roseomonas sp. KE0001]|uniref:YoaK family protein n=1 Tax=Roseomonas sp. KE0001 TaxID=2479201 RepID=UPI0018DF7364|nr:YoaK family protein [Roseomonas sp. KE0001]MBI0434430.1 DUF1275 domain-containing protein [Roseomonas sp. KE0001]